MTFRTRCKRYAILALAASAATLPALAQTSYVGAAGDGNWSDPNNWNPAAVPGSGANVNFINSDALARTLLYDYSGAPITLNLFQLDQRGTGSNTFVMADQALSTITESIGAATFNQTGGTHTITGTFKLGYNFGLNNLSPVTHYSLANDATLTVGGEFLGQSNSAIFTQDGGTHTVNSNLRIAAEFGSSAIYTLNSGSLVVKNFEYIGDDGTATFNQSGGTHTAVNLLMGFNGGTTGTLNLSGGTVAVDSVFAGYLTTGKGVLNISGGSMSVSTLTYVGSQQGSSINLLGGELTTPTLTLPDWNRLNLTSGTFTLTAYDRNIPGNLSIAGAATSSATMNFTGGNLPISGNEIVGSSGIAVFTQSAGTNSITGSLQIASAASAVGTVNYSGGTATSPRIYVGGSDVAAGGTGTLTLSGGTVTATTSIKIWNSPNSSIVLSGGTLSTPQLTVSDWNRVIVNAGTLNLTTGSSAGPGDFSIAAAAGGSATLNLTTGALQIGGSESIGLLGAGTINQNSGIHTASAIMLGVNPGAVGILNFSGGTLNTGNMFLGGSDTTSGGKATLKMTAGAMTATGGIKLWNADSAFALVNGILTAASITTPDWNQFSFTQGTLNLNGGDSAGAGNLIVGSGTGNATATLNLSSGSLTVGGTETIGFAGTTAANGTFNQTGGTHSAAQLYLGYGTSSGGTYSLSTGASLTVTGNENLGVSGQGTFNQTGGTHSLAMLQAGVNATGIGTLNLSGGTMTAGTIYLGGSDTAAGGKGTINLTGGTLLVTGIIKLWNTPQTALNLSTGALAADSLDLPDWSRLTFKSGSLTLSGNSSNSGTLSVGNAATLATLNLPSGSLTAQTLQLPGSGSGVVNQTGGTVTINQLSIAPPQSQHGTYNLFGSGALNAGNLTIAGTGTALFTQIGGTASIQNAIIVGGRGFAGTMNQAGGMVSAATETVASSSAATVTQSSGTNSVSNMNIGSSDLPGTYNLSGDANLVVSGAITVNSLNNSFFNQTGGTLSASSFTVGSNNTGSVTHSDGQATITNLVLGKSNGAGTYALSATGSLTITADETIGSGGNGTFTQSGGTHTVQGTLSLVPNGRQSTYDLSGTGVLNTATMVMGGAGGSSVFTQSGGTHNVSTLLTIKSVSNSYTLSGGDLNGDVLNHATFTQSGGTFTGNLTNSATLSLSGGVFNGSLVNSGTLNYSGGVLNAPLSISATGKVMVAAGANVSFYNALSGTAASQINVPANATANFQGNVTGSIIFTGTGTKNFQADQSSIGPITAGGLTTVDAGASLTSGQIVEKALTINGQLHLRSNSPTSKINTLAVGENGIFDIADNALIIDYTGSSPINSIRSLIIRNAVTSSSLTSSTAIGYAESADVLSPTGGNFQGSQADGTSVLVRYTLTGDSNLDGAVTFADLVAVAQHYGISDGSATWFTGDFNYDGNVSFADLVAVAQQYGGALPTAPIAGDTPDFNADLASAFSSVPEPNAILFLLLAGAMPLTRRLRRR